MSCNNSIIDYRPAKVKWYKKEGDNFLVELTLTDKNNTPIDLSNHDKIDLYVNDEVVASLGDGITVIGDDSNIIKIDKEDTTAAGEHIYKIVIEKDDSVRTYFEAKMIIT